MADHPREYYEAWGTWMSGTTNPDANWTVNTEEKARRTKALNDEREMIDRQKDQNKQSGSKTKYCRLNGYHCLKMNLIQGSSFAAYKSQLEGECPNYNGRIPRGETVLAPCSCYASVLDKLYQ